MPWLSPPVDEMFIKMPLLQETSPPLKNARLPAWVLNISLNIPGFWIFQGCTRFWLCLNMPEKFLNIPDYIWICLNMSEYAGMCLNAAKLVDFVLHFHIVITCLLERVVTYIKGYTKIGTWSCFLKETKFDFFYGSWKYLIFYV